MIHTDLKAHLALIKDAASDALNTLNEDEARTDYDVSHVAQPREATFRFAFSGPMTTTTLRALLSRISWKHKVDPGYVMVSTSDFKALVEETTWNVDIYQRGMMIMSIHNDHTGGSARIVVSPDIEVGEVTFGVLYAEASASVVDAGSAASGQTRLTMSS